MVEREAIDNRPMKPKPGGPTKVDEPSMERPPGKPTPDKPFTPSSVQKDAMRKGGHS